MYRFLLLAWPPSRRHVLIDDGWASAEPGEHPSSPGLVCRDLHFQSIPSPMTDRYTNAEWAALIADTTAHVTAAMRKETDIKAATTKPRTRAALAVGSKKFAQTIDHTHLKLDATPAQIDSLCSEARCEGFKVRRRRSSVHRPA